MSRAIPHELVLAACPSLRFASEVRWLDGDLPLEKALSPGERWITVHPPGHDKGMPLLIREHPDGTASVIGGAGGSMNHLKLRGVKPQSSYREALSEKAAARRAARKELLAQEKADGTHADKQAARADIQSKVKQVRHDFVQAVAQAAGWSQKDLQFDEEAHAGLSEQALSRARENHEKKLFQKARAVVDLNRKVLVSDHDARAAAGLGELPLASADADTLSANDLSPMPETAPGLGYAPNYGSRAAAHGLTQDTLDAAVAATKPEPTPEQVHASAEKKASADALKAEMQAFAAQNPDTAQLNPKVLEDAKKAADMVRALKRLRLVERAARDASAQVDAGALHESKAAVLEVTDAQVEQAAAEEIENAVATAGTRAFLQEADRLGGEQGIGGNLGTGAYNALNAVSMTVAGAPLIDRSVVDVLGVEASAAVLARRLQASMSPDELENARLAMADYHRDHYAKKQKETLEQAQAFHDAAAAIELPEASDGFELAEAQTLNARRRDAVNDAKRVIGQAMGEMRANAAVVMSLGASPVETLDITLGKQSAESAVVQLHALGLKDGDFTLAPAGDDLVVTLKPSAMDKLAEPVDTEGLAVVKRNLDIAAGKYDEDNWLPQGFSNRPDLAMKVEPGVAARLAKPFTPGPDLEQSLRDYIGGRVADGDGLQDILADVQSSSFFDKAGDNAAYRAALDKVAPLKGEDGKMRPIESLQGAFEGYADQFVADNYGPDVSPLHRQSFSVDDDAVDALHRALAKSPEGVAAYKSVGDLTPQERGGLRKWWHANVAKESPDAAAQREQLESMLEQEPEKTATDMFGETSTTPEWANWNAKRQELAAQVSSSSASWGKYVETMGSPQAAIEAVQDLVRSRVTSEFAKVYNTLKPDAPLKVGKTTIRGALDHLDAVDPAARDARLTRHKELLDSLRERIDGKYASGSVSDKVQAAKEAQQAFEQAQMGFFSVEDVAAPTEDKVQELGADERFTAGHAADMKLAGMMSVVGQNFRPGKPSAIWQPSMNGKYIAQQRAVKHIVANKRTVLGYGAGCVYGGTKLTCQMSGVTRSFYEWWLSGQRPVVQSVRPDGAKQNIRASAVFVKGYEPMLRVTLQDGAQAVVTPGHRFMDASGQWVAAAELRVGQALAIDPASRDAADADAALDAITQTIRSRLASGCEPHPACAGALRPSIADAAPLDLASVRASVAALFRAAHQSMLETERREDQPCCAGALLRSIAEFFLSVRRAGDRHCSRTGSGFLGRCSACSRPCDEQPRHASMAALSFGSSRGDVQGHIHSPERLGGLAGESSRSRPCRESCRRSTSHSFFQDTRLAGDAGCFAASCGSGSPLSRRQSDGLSEPSSSLGRGTSPSVPRLLPEPCARVGLLSSSVVVAVEDAGEHVVFDLTVPSWHSYVAQGMVHHNSGKTAIMLGAFSHLHETGKANRALYMVPSIVQGQFGGEALRFLEPGKFKWSADPGQSQAERIAAYKDPDTHFVVMTHQSFRDDLVHMGAQQAGLSDAEMSEKMSAMTAQERAAWSKQVLDAEEIHFDFSAVDEAHDTVNRAGKENSKLSDALDSVTDNTSYYVYASGDPIKNDSSELADVMAKMDRKRYGDREAFMRRYGPDTLASRQSLKREMARHVISNTIDSGAKKTRTTLKLDLSGGQKHALGELDKATARCKIARMEGKVDIEAARKLAPEQFQDVPEDKHAKVADAVQRSASIIRESAQRRILDTDPSSPKFDAVVQGVKDRKGKPGVVFARRRASIAQLEKRLTDEGFRVVTITGSDSAAEKDKKRLMFNPETGERQADVLLASDAAAVGMNLQSGQYLMQLDVPDTAKSHGQRNARIDRLGQKNDIELIDMQLNHKSEERARSRLLKKYALREFMLDPMDGLDDTGLAHFLRQRSLMAQQQKGAL